MGDDFLRAVEVGRRAAQHEKRRQEVASVVEALDTQIRAYTADRVGVEWDAGLGVNSAEVLAGWFHAGGLVLVGGDLRQPLCLLSMQFGGSQISIRYRSEEKFAASRVELVKLLNEMLARPQVGRIFNMILGPPEPTTPEATKP